MQLSSKTNNYNKLIHGVFHTFLFNLNKKKKIKTLFNCSVGGANRLERGLCGLVGVDQKSGLHDRGFHTAGGVRVPGRVVEQSARSRRREEFR